MKERLLKRVGGLLFVFVIIAVSVSAALALDPKGRPKGMGPNAPSGYFIWQDERGWHLRATTENQKHRFNGEVINDGGQISAVKQYREESASWFKQDGNRITIDLATDKNIDGIDFQSTGGSLTFRLRIDDREEPAAIHVGTNGDNPSGVPFTISVK